MMLFGLIIEPGAMASLFGAACNVLDSLKLLYISRSSMHGKNRQQLAFSPIAWGESVQDIDWKQVTIKSPVSVSFQGELCWDSGAIFVTELLSGLSRPI